MQDNDEVLRGMDVRKSAEELGIDPAGVIKTILSDPDLSQVAHTYATYLHHELVLVLSVHVCLPRYPLVSCEHCALHFHAKRLLTFSDRSLSQ